MDKKGQNRQSERGTLGQTILGMLEKAKENTLTISDLKKKLGVKRDAYQRGRFYPSHFYKTIKNLEDKRKIKIIPKRVPAQVRSESVVTLVKETPVGIDEIKPILDNLEDLNKVVHKNAAVDFHELSLRERIVITPDIAKVLKKILSNESYEGTRYYLLEGLLSTLITAKGGDDSQTIETIEENFPDILIKIASDRSDDIMHRISAIRLLGKLEVGKALEPIFSAIANEDERIFYKKLAGHLIEALCFLYPTFRVEIRTRLYQLLKNESTQKRAEFILSNIRERLGTVMRGASEEW